MFSQIRKGEIYWCGDSLAFSAVGVTEVFREGACAGSSFLGPTTPLNLFDKDSSIGACEGDGLRLVFGKFAVPGKYLIWGWGFGSLA